MKPIPEVAKEIVEWLGGSPKANSVEIVARALAACALENLEQGWELAQGRRRYEYDTMRAALERAAEEKL